MPTEPWKIGDRTFQSRLLVGTGKFPSVAAMQSALEASGTEIVTVALRRVDLTGQKDPQADMLEEIDPEKYLVLANTSGAMNAEEAVRLARLAVAAGESAEADLVPVASVKPVGKITPRIAKKPS